MTKHTSSNIQKPALSVSNMALIAVMTAATCILAPLSIQLGAIPISLTTLVIYFSLYLLGTKKATISYLVYMLLGICGLPVFSGFTGGIAKLFSNTGGYIIGFLFMAVIAGLMIEKFPKQYVLHVLGMIVGTLVCYAFGTAWFMFLTKTTLMAALVACVFPFLLWDFLKILLAVLVAPHIRKALNKAGLL